MYEPHSADRPSPQPSAPAEPPKFDPAAPHHQRPKLRPVRAFAAPVNGQTMMGLADARQISDRVIALPPQVQPLLKLLDGKRSIEEIASEFGHGLTPDILRQLVAQLDDAGLLFGPVYEALLAKMKTQFDGANELPPASTAAFGEALAAHKLGKDSTAEQREAYAGSALREAMDAWMGQALKDEAQQSFGVLPRAIIAPHIDYQRGWMNYASAWGRMRGEGVQRPDRVVILGTNHFGMGTGVVACNKGYQTPLGTCRADATIIEAFRRRLGAQRAEQAFEHRYDHEREHSIELQVAWVQHCLGVDAAGNFVPVMGVLVHDPSVNNGESYDGAGLGLAPFIEAMRGAIQDIGGKTLIVASADLSHAGPMFGDQQTLAGDAPEAKTARDRVMAHDNDMLSLVTQAKPDELIAAMAWQQNPTRWCSTGNLVAAMKIVQPERVELLRYLASLDQQGMGMVTSVAGVMR